MKTVWKFPLSAPEPARGGIANVEADMPIDAEIVRLAFDPNDRETVCVWAVVDPNYATERRAFIVVPTGAEWDDDREYVGTIESPPIGGMVLVFHVFEVES